MEGTQIVQVLPESLKAASIMFATVPILIVYPWMQKYFVLWDYAGLGERMKDKGILFILNLLEHQEHPSSGRELIEEIKQLGFHYVELNYNIKQEHLETIEPMIEQGEIGISSVHNVFPHIAD